MLDTEAVAPSIVVGLDGSEHSLKALAWAASYAKATGGEIRAVAAWVLPANYSFYVGTIGSDLEEATRKMAEEQVGWLKERYPDVEVEISVVAGHPAQALVDASKGTSLLVVGCRGHGGFVGMFLGSVSTHCVHAAHCPVLVVR